MRGFDGAPPHRPRRFLGAAAAPVRLAVGELRGTAPGRRSRAGPSRAFLIFLNGGMSHLDTFDPKPDQPAEIRGEFATVRTSARACRSPNTCPAWPGRRTA